MKFERISSEISMISKLEDIALRTAIKDVYCREFNLSLAMAEGEKIKAAAKRIEDAKAAEARRLEEVAKKAEDAKIDAKRIKPATAKIQVATRVVRFQITITLEQESNLMEYFKINNIKPERIDNGDIK